MSFSRSGSCYASTAKLINCLIACLLMLTVAFAAIPYFVVSHSKAKTAAISTKAIMNQAKIMAAKKNMTPSIFTAGKPYIYRTSSGKTETVVSKWIDLGLIDGILHAVARFSLNLGSFLRNAIDLPIVNGLADMFSEGVKRFGNGIRVIQTGRVQAYLIVGLFFTGLLLAYFLIFQP